MDDVSWQEVDVIVSQRHTSILHPLPENNISQRNLLCKFWFLTCGAGWVFPRPTKKVSEKWSIFSEAFQRRQNMILILLRCPVHLRHGWLMEVHLHFLHQVVETWGSKTYCVLKGFVQKLFFFQSLMQPLRSGCSRGFLHNVRIWEFPLQLLSDGQDQIPHDLNWSSLSDGEFVLFSQVTEKRKGFKFRGTLQRLIELCPQPNVANLLKGKP